MRFIGWRVVEIIVAAWLANMLELPTARGVWLALVGIWAGQCMIAGSYAWRRWRSFSESKKEESPIEEAPAVESGSAGR